MCVHLNYIVQMQKINFMFWGFIVLFVHDGLFAHLPLQPPPPPPVHIVMILCGDDVTYRMKERVVMQTSIV